MGKRDLSRPVRYYEILFKEHPKCGFVTVGKCPFCKSKNHLETSLSIKSKHFALFPESKYLRCSSCMGYFVNKIPNEELFHILYSKMYGKQWGGKKRFLANFKKLSFSDPVLEIGGGHLGIKDLCNSDYFSIDFDPIVTFNCGLLDVINDEKKINFLKQKDIKSVVTCDTIEHIQNPRDVFLLSDIVLKPGGRLYIQFGEIYYTEEDNINKWGSRDFSGPVQAPHINIPCEKSIREMMDGKFIILDKIQKTQGGIVFEKI